MVVVIPTALTIVGDTAPAIVVWSVVALSAVVGLVAGVVGLANPPKPGGPEFAVELEPDPGLLGDYEVAVALSVRNIGKADIVDCGLAKIEQIDRLAIAASVGLPFTLRPVSQAREGRNVPWNLRRGGEPKTVPVVLRDPRRPNEWYLLDALGKPHFVPAVPTEIVVGFYANETQPLLVRLSIKTGANWDPIVELTRVVRRPKGHGRHRP